MLDSINHITLKLIKNHIFGLNMPRFCHLLRDVKWTSLCNVMKFVNN